MIKKTIATALLVLLSASLVDANASIRNDVAQKSIQLMDSGNPRAAYNLLAAEPKTMPQDWFLYGMAAKNAGNMFEYRNAMREVITLDPNRAGRAKLELAQALYALESPDDAERLLREVKAENPPQLVRQNIDRFLAIIGDKGCHTNGNQRWCVTGNASVMYDSNVNNATTSKTVTLFGLPFKLSKDARAQSDIAYRLSARIDHIVTVNDKMAWQSDLGLYWTDYFKLNRFDVLQFTASTGPVFQLDEKTILSLPVTAEAVSYTDQGDFYSLSLGFAPQLRHKLNETVSLNLGAKINWKRFIDNIARDTTSYSIAPGIDIRTCGQGTFRIGGTLGRDDSGIDIYSNDNWELNTSIYCPVGANTVASLYASYGESRYDVRESAYAVKRHDKRTVIGGTMQYAHQPSGFDGIFNVTYTHNGSNLTLYGYDKWQVTGTLRKKF